MQKVNSPFDREASAVLLFEARDVDSGDAFQVMRCGKTAIGFTHPQPEEPNRYYPRNYREFHPLVAGLFRFLYGRSAAAIIRRIGPRKKLLEIGCGAGWMLEAFARRGWEAEGFERTAEIAGAVAARTGLPVFAGPLEALEPKGVYDVVMLYNVLEHLTDPGQTLETCRALLKPSGCIVITVPNFASWQARLTRASWFHLDVPRHLFHFSGPTLRAFLAGKGLRVETVRTVSAALDLFGWVQSLQNLLPGEPNRFHKLLLAPNPLKAALTPAGLAACALTVLLTPPALLATIAGRLFGRGAIIEFRATPRQEEETAE